MPARHYLPVRDGIVSILGAAEKDDFKTINSTLNRIKVSTDVILKILSIYTPEKFITIGHEHTLKLLSRILEINTEGKSLIEINNMCQVKLCTLDPALKDYGFNVLGSCIWRILSPAKQKGFVDWFKKNRPKGSGSADSYSKSIEMLCYFYKENLYGNNPDLSRLKTICAETLQYQRTNNGLYFGGRSSSYGRKGWYSAAIGNYIKYLEGAAPIKSDTQESHPAPDGFSIFETIKAVKSTGLFLKDLDIKRLVFSLMTKRFVILSGLSGSGKTQLALALSHAICEDANKQICFIPVGADWTNREPLLGYPNALDDTKYFIPENSAIPLLVEAQKPENQDKPFFLILDEMNLSVVERYFADFLSAMETSERSINLWRKTNDKSPDRGVPSTLILGNNVFIIGTINVDETTYMFSPKVLDRANVIEFKITAEEMSQYLESDSSINIGLADGAAASCAAEFVSDIKVARRNEINTVLSNFFVSLKKLNAEFGYRSANEIYKFIGIALEKDDSEKKMTLDQAIDSAIVQKLLPKLHGSKTKLSPVLKEMWRLCFKDAKPQTELEDAKTGDDGKPIYPLTADKIFRMYKWAFDNGFASFAEA
jgi:hypothetical protein